jgi:dipeptidyl aminopeptidase/acylaminoacyl peptidase
MEAIHFPTRINSLAWSPDNRQIAAACADGSVYVRDIQVPEVRHSISLWGHAGEALSVTWSPDGKRIASGGTDHRVQIWNAKTGASLRTPLKFDDEVSKVQWAPHGHRFLIVAGKRVWVMQEEVKRQTARPKSSHAWAIRGEPTARLSQALLDHSSLVVDAEWSPNGEYIATASSHLTIQVWDAVEEEWVLSLNEAMGVVRLKWAPDGLRVAVGTNQGSIYIYRSAGGQLMEQYCVSDAPIRDLSWIESQRALSSNAVLAGQQMKVVGQQTEIIPLQEPKTDRVLAFSSDGKFLAARSQNRVVHIYPCSQIESRVS